MLDLAPYVPTDPYFGAPFIDVDEERSLPYPHRHVHGGFENTDTRFRFWFPPKEQWQGRMFNPLSGAHGGTEDFFGSPFGEMIGGLGSCFRLGGYMVESNQGHFGDDLDARAGADPTLYGHRASAEVALFSKFVAQQVYGTSPHHSYVFGGSGGGRRSPLCIENAPGVWDGALPFMGGGDVAEPGNTKLVKGAQNIAFSTMFNVQRILGSRLAGVVDAMSPGGSGNPFEGLDTHQREELASLYRQGFPRGDERMIGEQMGQIWLWSATADLLYEQDPEYFTNFWTKPGYIGHDQPSAVAGDLIDLELTIDRLVTLQDVLEDPAFSGPEFTSTRRSAFARRDMGTPAELPFGVVVKGVGDGYRLGVGLRMVDGAATGRQLYCTSHAGDAFFCDGRGEASIQRFTGAQPGDRVHVDNRRFLAFCYWSRHHLLPDAVFDSFRLDGIPIHPQHEAPEQSPLMGVAYSGSYEGKVMWVHHTHDSSLWPAQGVVYRNAVEQAQGPERLAANFRLRWTEHAEHVPPIMLPPAGNRSATTMLVDYLPVIEQSLADLAAWVEHGIEPAPTNYQYLDGQVLLPTSAAERGGIQPVVIAAANGAVRAEVRVGEPVTLSVAAEAPPGAGTIVGIKWDFDGSGSFAHAHDDIDGTATAVTRSLSHTYDVPGTYFATALVEAHRDGDVAATSRRVPNLAQVRVVVS
ncbi:MAG: tannase/feruloyl esterase family alpha/beta hydrolase [Actinomycetota bacterium]|nr:tannase/feruloyl esterase family alpha/beta hydrolase [Actinomycetota bacterium]